MGRRRAPDKRWSARSSLERYDDSGARLAEGAGGRVATAVVRWRLDGRSRSATFTGPDPLGPARALQALLAAAYEGNWEADACHRPVQPPGPTTAPGAGAPRPGRPTSPVPPSSPSVPARRAGRPAGRRPRAAAGAGGRRGRPRPGRGRAGRLVRAPRERHEDEAARRRPAFAHDDHGLRQDARLLRPGGGLPPRRRAPRGAQRRARHAAAGRRPRGGGEPPGPRRRHRRAGADQPPGARRQRAGRAPLGGGGGQGGAAGGPRGPGPAPARAARAAPRGPRGPHHRGVLPGGEGDVHRGLPAPEDLLPAVDGRGRRRRGPQRPHPLHDPQRRQPRAGLAHRRGDGAVRARHHRQGPPAERRDGRALRGPRGLRRRHGRPARGVRRRPR